MTEVFAIAPASAKPLWFVGVICAVLGAVLVMLAVTAYASRHSSVEVGPDAITLRGDLWGRSVPLRALELERAEVLDLGRDRERRPSWRSFGTGLPGYASGWFRLKNGEKALAYLTRQDRVAYIPTREGYALLLSVEQPEQLLAALRARAGG
jgi:hypothetical protein